MVTPAARRQAAGFLQADFEVSERRACSVVELPRATCRYQSVTVEDPQLRKDLRQLAGEWPRYGYRMLHELLKRKGWAINHKLVYPHLPSGGAHRAQTHPQAHRCRAAPAPRHAGQA
jgi:putative transposase